MDKVIRFPIPIHANTAYRFNASLTDVQIANMILHKVVDFYAVPDVKLLGKRTRKHEILNARQAAMYFMWVHTEIPLFTIGKWFNRDHTTVMHARDTVLTLMDVRDEAIWDNITTLRKWFRNVPVKRRKKIIL